mgnify:CR=1 FL=1
MDVLITMGSSAAFFYSIIGVSMHWGTNETHSYLFFETTATIITLVMLGNVLEHRSVKKTTTAIQELSSIQQSDAKKENKDGSIISIPFEEICINDLLVINMGDKIPTDGNVVEGDGFVDESMINGENNPIHKTKDHNLIGGTILIEGHLKMIAKKVGSETVLSQIIKLVKQAQREKPKIQLLGDKVSNIFEGKTFVVSGVFNRYSRNELKSLIESYGGKNLSTVSSKTNFLLAGDKMLSLIHILTLPTILLV